MIDIGQTVDARELKFSSDTSASKILGFGVVFNNRWISTQWEPGFIERYEPSIEYLELFTLTAAVLTWGEYLKDIRILIYCDNTAIVSMVNNNSSSCPNCTQLLRLLTLNNLINNRRVFVRYILTTDNYLSDALSRLQYSRFWKLAPPGMSKQPSEISPLVWPATKVWQDYDRTNKSN